MARFVVAFPTTPPAVARFDSSLTLGVTAFPTTPPGMTAREGMDRVERGVGVGAAKTVVERRERRRRVGRVKRVIVVGGLCMSCV